MSSPSERSRWVTVARIPKGERYEDRGTLGKGGMGEVRAVVDRRIRRGMAMKILADDLRDQEDAILRFVEEAQITGQLDHPNIVPLHELGQSKTGELFFTMKRVEGETYAELLSRLGADKLGTDNLEHIIEILIKVCDALELAHSRGVLHRDLKPSNVMIGQYGQVYVLDWGLAYLKSGEQLTDDDGLIIGTPGFMAPEQAHNRPLDERVDVYAVGGLLYCALADQMPHTAKDAAARLLRTKRLPVPSPEDVRVGVDLPPELCRIAMRALQQEPDRRSRSVAELRDDLRRFQRGGGWLRTRVIPPGDPIILQGDQGSEAYIILDGECLVTKMVAGKEQVLRRMGPGEVFGEMALLTGGARTASVHADTEVTVKVVTRRSLERELQRSDWLGALVRVLADRFREVDGKLSALRHEIAADDAGEM